MKNTSRNQRIRLITIQQAGASCSLCESEITDSGTIFKGQCVCRGCLDFIRTCSPEMPARAAESCSQYAR